MRLFGLYRIMAVWGNMLKGHFCHPVFMINHLACWGRWQQAWQTSRRHTQKIPFSGYITLWSYKLFLCPTAIHNEDSRHTRQRTDVCPSTHTSKRTLPISGTHAHTIVHADIPSLPPQHTHAHISLPGGHSLGCRVEGWCGLSNQGAGRPVPQLN